MQEKLGTQVPSLGQEDPLEEKMATHSSILAWRMPWTEEPGGPQFTVSQSQARLRVCTHISGVGLLDQICCCTHVYLPSHFSCVQLFVTPWTKAHGLLCPQLYPGIHSSSCPSSQWCYLTNLSSAAPFSSCLQSCPESGSFPMSQLFASGGQSIAASASASVLPVNIQHWFPLGFIHLLAAQGTLKSLLQPHNSIHRFFGTQPSLWSNSYICTWLLKNYSFDYTDFCWQSDISTFYYAV